MRSAAQSSTSMGCPPALRPMARALSVAPGEGGAPNLVVLDYAEVVNPEADLSDRIEEGWGYDGLGLLCVAGVPDHAEQRAQLLRLAHSFATLPDDVKLKYEHAASFYNFGWSHGKEMLEGRPDLSKGSFYANPLVDKPYGDDPAMFEKCE